jgi:hypothetical protein
MAHSRLKDQDRNLELDGDDDDDDDQDAGRCGQLAYFAGSYCQMCPPGFLQLDEDDTDCEPTDHYTERCEEDSGESTLTLVAVGGAAAALLFTGGVMAGSLRKSKSESYVQYREAENDDAEDALEKDSADEPPVLQVILGGEGSVAV